MMNAEAHPCTGSVGKTNARRAAPAPASFLAGARVVKRFKAGRLLLSQVVQSPSLHAGNFLGSCLSPCGLVVLVAVGVTAGSR